jgi:hypothetical protein
MGVNSNLCVCMTHSPRFFKLYPLEGSYGGWQCYPLFGIIDQNQQHSMLLMT